MWNRGIKCMILENMHFKFLYMLFIVCRLFSSSLTFSNTTRVSNSLDPDQAQRFYEPDLDSNCLQMLSADDKMSLHVTLRAFLVFVADGDYKFPLDAASKKKAEKELNEIESDRADAVQAFRKWVLDQKDWLKSPTGERSHEIRS